MARKTRLQSAVQIEANFPNNNAELITPAITREYLLDNIDSTQYLDVTSTRAALQTIQAASGLVLDQWYKITDAVASKVLLIKASSANTFYPNAVNLTDGNSGTYDIGTNVFTAAAGGGGGIQTIVAGTNITVDSTDPNNPIVTAAGGGGPFQNTDLTLTKAASATAITAATIDVTRNYIISDGLASGDRKIRLLPSSANSFYVNCENLTDKKSGRYTIATDWFIPVDNIYAIAPSVLSDITKGYVTGDLYIVGGTTYKAASVGVGAAVWAIIFTNEVDKFSSNGGGQLNTGINVIQLGAAGYQNAGNNVNQLGGTAGLNNIGNDANQLGIVAGQGNTGNDVNQLGNTAGNANTGNDVNQLGKEAGNANTGNDVNQLGKGAGKRNTKSGGQFFGPNAGYDVAIDAGYTGSDNVFTISNESIAQFADRSEATAAITIAKFYLAGSTYIYCNLATNAVEYVRL